MIVAESDEVAVVKNLLVSQTREITTHQVSGEIHGLRLQAFQALGKNNPTYEYLVSYKSDEGRSDARHQSLRFQHGPVASSQNVELTNEVLLAIVMDRSEAFQAGPMPCEENGKALFYLDKAMAVLQTRTIKRVVRQVEGTRHL